MVLWIEKRRYVSVIMLVLLAAQIFWVSSLSGSTPGKTEIPFVAITYHFCAFFLFGFFLFFSMKGNKKTKFTYVFLALFLSLLYAISDEFHQSFVPLRDASFADVATDFIGMSVSIFLGNFISKKSNQQF